MAPQSNQTVQNDTFPKVRASINDNLEALFTQSSGVSEPDTTVAYQTWVDTSTSPHPTWKIRNSDNNGWITVGVLDPANFKVGGVTPIANGGTGQTTIASAIAALLPSQTGNADKALTTNGTSLLWSVITASSFTKYTFAAGTGTGSTRTHTWTKPSSGSTAIVLIWGGGGGGGKDDDGGGGGAGSNCGFSILRLADLGATGTITIGQGGAGRSGGDGEGAAGANSLFATNINGTDTVHARSYGGVGGEDSSNRRAQGSTPFGIGSNNSSVAARDNFAYSFLSGGTGGVTRIDEAGADAVFGGAGGGGCNSSGAGGDGGTSLLAGNGGKANADSTPGVDGHTPGGGGGGSEDQAAGDGGDGECWVIVF